MHMTMQNHVNRLASNEWLRKPTSGITITQHMLQENTNDEKYNVTAKLNSTKTLQIQRKLLLVSKYLDKCFLSALVCAEWW